MNPETQTIYNTIVGKHLSFNQLLALAVSLIEHVSLSSKERAVHHFDEEN